MILTIHACNLHSWKLIVSKYQFHEVGRVFMCFFALIILLSLYKYVTLNVSLLVTSSIIYIYMALCLYPFSRFPYYVHVYCWTTMNVYIPIIVMHASTVDWNISGMMIAITYMLASTLYYMITGVNYVVLNTSVFALCFCMMLYGLRTSAKCPTAFGYSSRYVAFPFKSYLSLAS